jgi:hypothetical protein
LNPSVRTVKTVRDIISESEANDDEDAIVAASLNNIDSSSTTTRRPFSANEGDPIATRRRDIIVGMKEVGLPSALAWALPESIIIEELSVVAHLSQPWMSRTLVGQGPTHELLEGALEHKRRLVYIGRWCRSIGWVRYG